MLVLWCGAGGCWDGAPPVEGLLDVATSAKDQILGLLPGLFGSVVVDMQLDEVAEAGDELLEPMGPSGIEPGDCSPAKRHSFFNLSASFKPKSSSSSPQMFSSSPENRKLITKIIFNNLCDMTLQCINRNTSCVFYYCICLKRLIKERFCYFETSYCT